MLLLKTYSFYVYENVETITSEDFKYIIIYWPQHNIAKECLLLKKQTLRLFFLCKKNQSNMIIFQACAKSKHTEILHIFGLIDIADKTFVN